MRALGVNTGVARLFRIGSRNALSGIGKNRKLGHCGRALGSTRYKQADLSVQGGLAKAVYGLPPDTWAGLLLSGVLYFMFITGSLGYFNSEIDRWMDPGLYALSIQPAEPGAVVATRLAQRLEDKAPGASAWYLTLPQGRKDLLASVYAEPALGAGGEAFSEQVDPSTGLPFVASRKTGGGAALYTMHYELRYMNPTVAMYLVGVATLFMLLALVTGVVVHKKILADLFTFRPGKGQRSWLDAHNLSSVMALPFFLVITYSGLLFYTYEYMPTTQWASYGLGEDGYKAMQQARTSANPATDPHLKPSGQRAPLVPLGSLVAQAESRWGVGQVEFLEVVNPGDANSRVVMERAAHARISRRGDTLLFNGSSGALLGERADPSGGADESLSSVMLALHEGHFASPLLRWLYFGSGLMGAAMIATGLVLWTKKRRQRLKPHEAGAASLRFVEHFNVGLITGLPLGLALYFLANRLLPVDWAARADWEMHALFSGWALCFVHASARPVARAWVEQWFATGALLVLLPLVNAATTTIHLGHTLPARNWVLAGVDLTALAAGLICWVVAWRLWKREPQPARAVPGNLSPGAPA